LASFRKVTGPISTGRVVIPKNLASLNSSTALVVESAKLLSAVSSGTM